MHNVYQRIEHLLSCFSTDIGQLQTPLSHCSFVRLNGQGNSCPAFYTPSLCLVIKGRKTADINGRNVTYSAGDGLIASMNLPATTHIESCNLTSDFLGLQIELDFDLLSLTAEQMQLDIGSTEEPDLFCLQVVPVDSTLLQSVENYLQLIAQPDDLADLQQIRLQEIYIRLLRRMPANLLFQLVRGDNISHRIHRVTGYIESNLNNSISIPRLAELSNMSISSFHQNFKKVTQHSPLQYIKRLRLTEARKLMLSRGFSVSAAAYEVGYESPSQFSREYSRLFGLSPRADLTH
ncbi:AraC family transcriptional regulator N-terminal domain-containing protein [Pontibacter sp. JAM-7]|uniref:AraC family transcriptional regulator n=1 Tax=Pontibacter sp. JAM-7 TaxID=3366581 RepID=UPI003AF7F089